MVRGSWKSAEGEAMRIAVYVLIVLLALMTTAAYAALVVSSEAEEKDKRLYERWKNERSR